MINLVNNVSVETRLEWQNYISNFIISGKLFNKQAQSEMCTLKLSQLDSKVVVLPGSVESAPSV